MVASVQAHYHHQLAATTPAGNPQEDLDVLKHLNQQLEELLAQLQHEGPSPELLNEINIQKGAIEKQLGQFVAAEKAAHGGQPPGGVADEVKDVNEDLDSVTIDMNNLSQDPKSPQFLANLEEDLGMLNKDIQGMGV